MKEIQGQPDEGFERKQGVRCLCPAWVAELKAFSVPMIQSQRRGFLPSLPKVIKDEETKISF